jgi:lipoate-protein ligase B
MQQRPRNFGIAADGAGDYQIPGSMASRMQRTEPAMDAVEWQASDTPVGYEAAVAAMEARVAAISSGTAPELVWLLEHPPLYTAGSIRSLAFALVPAV